MNFHEGFLLGPLGLALATLPLACSPVVDQDGDGWIADLDCNDNNAALNLDDSDGDGFTTCDDPPDCDDGDPAASPADIDMDGHSSCDGDCDDDQARTHPGAEEVCDGLDNDCNGVAELNEEDHDEDSYVGCEPWVGTLPGIAGGGDCDEDNDAIHPGADEVCDGVDNDCDGEDDNVNAVEVCDGVDNDCDGNIDDVDEDGDGDPPQDCDGGNDCDDSDAEVSSFDDDGDGVSTCDDPPDCDAADGSIFPGATEECDSIDHNCDGFEYAGLEETCGPPVITGINGSGTLQAVNDFQGLTDGIVGPDEAPNRFLDTWVVTGEYLDLDTDITMVQTELGNADFDASDGLVFSGGSASEQTLSLPVLLAEGRYELTLTNPVGFVTVDVYVLQGDPGEPGESALTCDGTDCSLGEDLLVDGDLVAAGATVSEDLTVLGAATAGAAFMEDLSVVTSIEMPDCPAMYDAVGGICEREVSTGVYDEMVSVGDFWIDRHELSLWSDAGCTGTPLARTPDDLDNASFPDTGEFGQPVYGCSLEFALPASYMTWFQAQQACALSGKTLCTNDQWQAAASGTVENDCHLGDVALANTGTHTACVSSWGAMDMVGNLWEWVADWQGHPGWNGPAMTFTSEFGDDTYSAGGPDANAMVDFGLTGSWRTQSPAMPGGGNSMGEEYGPAAVHRGGSFDMSTDAGVFALHLGRGPSYGEFQVGARCCIQTVGRTGP